MSKKRFKVAFDTLGVDAFVVIEVDYSIFTPQIAKEINEFYSDHQHRLRELSGDETLAVIRLFGSLALNWAYSDGGLGFSDEEQAEYITNRVLEYAYEGWPKYENLGLRIVEGWVDLPCYDSVTIEEDDG